MVTGAVLKLGDNLFILDSRATDLEVAFDSGEIAITTNQEYIIPHGLGVIPGRVQVWVKSDGANEGPLVYSDVQDWKPAGILSLYSGVANDEKGTIIEAINSSNIIIRTGLTGLWHGHKDNDWFKTGSAKVLAWK